MPPKTRLFIHFLPQIINPGTRVLWLKNPTHQNGKTRVLNWVWYPGAITTQIWSSPSSIYPTIMHCGFCTKDLLLRYRAKASWIIPMFCCQNTVCFPSPLYWRQFGKNLCLCCWQFGKIPELPTEICGGTLWLTKHYVQNYIISVFFVCFRDISMKW